MKCSIGSLLALWLSCCLLAPSACAGQVVTVKGMSFFEPGREALAREKALDDARRAAIEQAVGTAIESRSVVENFELVKDRIFSRTSGYIRSFEILEERQTALGTYEVTARAEVETAGLAEDVDRFRQMLGWQKNPRVSIVVEKGVSPDHRAAAAKAAGLLAAKLQSAGFSVYKHTPETAGRMGLMVGLTLESSSVQSDYQGLKLDLNEISLSANVYRTGDDAILASAAAVRSLPGANRLQALDKGARACVDELWGGLRSDLTRLWEAEMLGEREIALVLRGVPTHNRALEIAGVLETEISGMTAADLLRYAPDGAEYRLRYRGWPEALNNELQMSYVRSTFFRMTLEAIRGNTVVMRLQ